MFLEQLKQISTFIFDIDGVLTTGDIIASDSGQYLRTFNVKDGYAIQLAVKKGYQVCILSGGSGEALQKRFEGLGITNIFLGVSDKVEVYNRLCADCNINAAEVLYMGDDIPDLKIMKLVGVATCPADAVPEIKAVSHYISPYAGGRTAVRDVIEKVLKVQEKWFDENPSAADSGK